jgi:hypothetical protein
MFANSKAVTRIGAILIIVGIGGLSCIQILKGQSGSVPPSHILNLPVDVGASFTPSGFMGDGERNPENVRLKTVIGEKPRAGDANNTCIKVEYQPGSQGWAGIYWLNPADNWGTKPGYSIKGNAQRVTFWAAGAKGGEIVEFKAGGIESTNKFTDSFVASTGSIALTNSWKRYEFSLQGKNLTSILGGFAWVATGNSNPQGLVFYLDDIRYE